MTRQLIKYISFSFFILFVCGNSLFCQELEKFVFEREKISVKLPAGWEVKEIHANNVVAMATKPFESEYDNFSEEILITAGYTEENPPTLEESLGVLLQQITFLYGKSCIYDTGTEQLGDKKVVWVLYGEQDGNLDRKNINYIYVNGKYQYMLWCYSLEESFDKIEPLFDAIAKSLSYLE